MHQFQLAYIYMFATLANAVAASTVTLLALDRELFITLMGPLREVLDNNMNMRVLENIKLFSKLSKEEKSKVALGVTFRASISPQLT